MNNPGFVPPEVQCSHSDRILLPSRAVLAQLDERAANMFLQVLISCRFLHGKSW